MWSLLSAMMYPAPESALMMAATVLSFAWLVFLAVSELRGIHGAYSYVVPRQQHRTPAIRAESDNVLLSTRRRMLVVYVPSLIAAMASFAVPAAVEGLRARLLAAALTVYFLKRLREVLFIHRYRGRISLNTVLIISSNYLLNTMVMIYAEYLTRGLPEPKLNLLYPGMLVFVIGLAGNLYHHYLLSRLRVPGGENGYKNSLEAGGLFKLVACPHHLFEIITFVGFAMISQTMFALVLASGTMLYLASRSYVTRRWYISRFDDFPARIKALVPYVL